MYLPHKGPQEAFLSAKIIPEVLFGGARGGGKGLELSEEVLTSKGWTTIEDLKVGDVIFDANGAPTTVLYKSEPTLRACYRLTFDNGQQIIADDVHRWITYTKAERVSNYKCSPEYREKRKASRPSRAKAEPKNVGSQKTVTERNKSRVYQYKEPNTGTMRDTQEIFETLKVQNGREVNHAIKLAGIIQHTEKVLPIPPYVLGVWLGDGSRSSGRLTIGQQDSEELVKELNSFGYSCQQSEYDAITYKIERDRPFITELKELGVTDSKHIPESYLTASPEQRLELLQGLFDTDGSCAKDGQVEFCNTNETLARGVFELLASLGVKPFITTKTPLCTNGKNGPIRGARAWVVKATTTLPVFRLSRKKERLPTTLRETQKWHYITNVEPVESVWTQCLTVDSPTHTFLVSRSFIPTHNTAGLLADFLQDVYEHRLAWQGVLFRRTYPELEEVIKQSFRFYPETGGTYKVGTRTWSWPGGATLKLRSLESADDATKYQGHEYSFIGWDEVTNWPNPDAYQMLIGCLRSSVASTNGKVPARIRASGNPGGVGHQWVKDRWQIGKYKDGFVPIHDKDSGMTRMYIPSRTRDNPSLTLNSPNYEQQLRAVGSAELVKAWLEGDWEVVLGAYFDEWDEKLHVISDIDMDDIPPHWKIYRAYDHGSYHPFCVLWYTVAGNEWGDVQPGTILVLREWWGGDDEGKGIKMSVADIAEGIMERESEFHRRVEAGPADTQIFEEDGGRPISEILSTRGAYFFKADKRRIPGWNQVRNRLANGLLKVSRCCRWTRLTLPALQHDRSRPEDIDTTGNDHAADCLRYACMAWPITPQSRNSIKKKLKGPGFADLVDAAEDVLRRNRL